MVRKLDRRKTRVLTGSWVAGGGRVFSQVLRQCSSDGTSRDGGASTRGCRAPHIARFSVGVIDRRIQNSDRVHSATDRARRGAGVRRASRRCAVVVAEHPAQALAPQHAAGQRVVVVRRFDQHVAKTLMIAFGVVVREILSEQLA